MKTILFNATGDESFSGRLDAVLDLARAFDAHVTLLHAIPYEAAGAIDFHGAAFAAMVPYWREEAAKLRDRTLDDLSNEGVSWNWVEAAGPVALAGPAGRRAAAPPRRRQAEAAWRRHRLPGQRGRPRPSRHRLRLPPRAGS